MGVEICGQKEPSEERGIIESLVAIVPILSSPIALFMSQTAIYSSISWLAAKFHTRQPTADAGPSRGNVPGPPYRVPTEETVANFASMIEQAKAAGAHTIIVPNPHVSGAQRLKGIDDLNCVIADRFSAEATILRLDAMQPANPRAIDYFGRDGYHPNHAGAQYIATAIARAVLDERDLNIGTETSPAGG